MFQEILQDGVRMSVDVARGVADMIPYIVQFMATGPTAGATKATVQKSVQALIDKGIKKEVRNKVLKTAIGYAPKVTGYTAGAVARTQFMPMTWSGWAERMTAGEEPLEALKNAQLTTFSEVFTEGLAGPFGKEVKKGLTKVLTKIDKSGKLPNFLETMQKVEANSPKVIKEIKTRGGWNGVIGQYGEELFNAYLQAGLTGDKKLSEVWDGREQLTTLLTVGIFGGIVQSPAVIKSIREDLSVSRDNIPEEIRDDVVAASELNTVEEKVDAVEKILEENEI